jgi:bifunctional UDP-N-acetylglucosamine pyrophosphorylase / glucosamine-1-phosphate N-acetyltransferase
VSARGPAAVIILAAGEGTRMKTRTPKVLHRVCGRTMLGHVLATARELSPARLIVVTGHAHGEVGAELAEQAPDATVVLQERRGGTGHAVRTVIESTGLIRGTIVVTYADTPLLRSQTLAELIGVHESGGAAVTVLTALAADPAGYGRIIRDSSGGFAQIVEHADATPAQRAIKEINSGVYAFDGELLADVIKRLPTGNVKGEEYLTDAVGLLRGGGHPVASVRCGDPDEVLGVNDQAQLAWARRVLNERVLRDTTAAAGPAVTQPACESAAAGPGASGGPFARRVPGSTPAGGQRVAGHHLAAAGSGQPGTQAAAPRHEGAPDQ